MSLKSKKKKRRKKDKKATYKGEGGGRKRGGGGRARSRNNWEPRRRGGGRTPTGSTCARKPRTPPPRGRAARLWSAIEGRVESARPFPHPRGGCLPLRFRRRRCRRRRTGAWSLHPSPTLSPSPQHFRSGRRIPTLFHLAYFFFALAKHT